MSFLTIPIHHFSSLFAPSNDVNLLALKYQPYDFLVGVVFKFLIFDLIPKCIKIDVWIHCVDNLSVGNQIRRLYNFMRRCENEKGLHNYIPSFIKVILQRLVL